VRSLGAELERGFAGPEPLRLVTIAEAIDEQALTALDRTLAEHPGRAPVLLHVVDSDGNEEILRSARHRVNRARVLRAFAGIQA
jgi:hypothetical protein